MLSVFQLIGRCVDLRRFGCVLTLFLLKSGVGYSGTIVQSEERHLELKTLGKIS
jgi:hypothetical protein